MAGKNRNRRCSGRTSAGQEARHIAFALRFNGRKRMHDADETMSRITAERLVEHSERSGYVVMH